MTWGNRIGQDRCRAIGPHTAGIGAGIALADALVILGAADRQTCLPSHSTKNDASSPAMNSSITTSAPATPSDPPNISSIAAFASAAVIAITTPLPAANPSALMTIGAPVFSTCACAADVSENRAHPAVGAPQASQISLVNALDASSRAAAAEGPKVRIPPARNASATPAAKGASGPTTTKSTAFSTANANTAPPSSTSISAHSANWRYPDCPGPQSAGHISGFA